MDPYCGRPRNIPVDWPVVQTQNGQETWAQVECWAVETGYNRTHLHSSWVLEASFGKRWTSGVRSGKIQQLVEDSIIMHHLDTGVFPDGPEGGSCPSGSGKRRRLLFVVIYLMTVWTIQPSWSLWAESCILRCSQMFKCIHVGDGSKAEEQHTWAEPKQPSGFGLLELAVQHS